jgi:hypothetical protein
MTLSSVGQVLGILVRQAHADQAADECSARDRHERSGGDILATDELGSSPYPWMLESAGSTASPSDRLILSYHSLRRAVP